MRNKKLADIILVTLFIGFIIITLIRIFILKGFMVELISFTIEAALVGAVADWFAVTALFRKPLGFSWHTAIIPRNKEKVIEAISSVVESELLSIEGIKNRLERLNIVDRLIIYIEKSKNKLEFVDLLEKYSNVILNTVDASKVAGYTEGILKNGLEQINLTLHISNILDWAIKNDVYDNILEILVEELIKAAKNDSTREVIYSVLNSEIRKSMDTTTGFKRVFLEISLGLAEGTNSINISEAAVSLQKELVQMLIAIKNKDNEFYFRLKDTFEETGERLKKDEALSNSIEVWKKDIISEIYIQEDLERLICDAKSNVVNNAMLIKWIEEQLNKYWNNFKQDDIRKNWVNEKIKEMLYKIIEAEHHLLGQIVKDTLGSFTDEALNGFIESKTGNDLHWIRVNGSMVGAVTGIVLFLFLNIFYDPVIVPIIRSWF